MRWQEQRLPAGKVDLRCRKHRLPPWALGSRWHEHHRRSPVVDLRRLKVGRRCSELELRAPGAVSPRWHDPLMLDQPRLPARVVRFHWAEVGNLDARHRVPAVDVQVETEGGPVVVRHEVVPAASRCTATRRLGRDDLIAYVRTDHACKLSDGELGKTLVSWFLANAGQLFVGHQPEEFTVRSWRRGIPSIRRRF